MMYGFYGFYGFCGFMNSREPFNPIKDNQINFDDVVKRQNEFLNKLTNITIGKKTPKQRETIDNLEKCCHSKEEVINFFRNYGKMVLDATYKSKQNKTEGKGLKILTPKQMLQRLLIALAQAKAGNNSGSLLRNQATCLFFISIQTNN